MLEIYFINRKLVSSITIVKESFQGGITNEKNQIITDGFHAYLIIISLITSFARN